MNRMIELLFGVSASGIAAVCALSLHLHSQGTWARIDGAVDEPGAVGDRVPAMVPTLQVEALVQWAASLSLQVGVHAIGDVPVDVTVSGAGALSEWKHDFLSVQLDLNLAELVTP